MKEALNRSPIYYRLQEAKDADEIVCMFAYAIYKKQKMQEIRRLEEKLQRPPTDEELQPFIDNAATRIESFLKLAEIELSNFQETIIGNYIDSISNLYEEKYAEAVKKFQPQPAPSWLKSAFYGLAGNILTAIITFVLAVIALVAVKGFPGLWQTILPFIEQWAKGNP